LILNLFSTSRGVLFAMELPVPPSVNEVLEGYGEFRNGLYHTHVRCLPSGQAWDCHGFPTAAGIASLLCAGPGSHALAQCIEGGDEAGIFGFYGRAGVCHQIANLVLGYPLSVIGWSDFLTWPMAHLASICRGCRGIAGGQTENKVATRLEHLLPWSVLALGGSKLELVAP
jgi:hypothetical protein